MILNEDIFDEIEQPVPDVEAEVLSDSEIQPEGPQQGEATGVANLIHDLIINVNDSIEQYNNAAANMENYPELQKIMFNIAGEEYVHMGELQKALELISPNAEMVEQGEAETEEVLKDVDPGSPVDEALIEDTKKKSNGKWINKGKDGEHGEFKTKHEADAQRKAMFANGYHEELEEALYIPDDQKLIRLIDKGLRNSEVSKKLTVGELEDLANYVNEILHSASEKKPREKRW